MKFLNEGPWMGKTGSIPEEAVDLWEASLYNGSSPLAFIQTIYALIA